MAAVMDDTVDTNDGTDQEQYSLAKGRSRREKKDKGGRFAALKRLKEAKASGEKLKYEVVDERNVYDEVDEREYSKIVQERQEDDWIVDDDGGGYVEDGREVFDDELNDTPADDDKKGKGKNKKKQNPNIRPTDSKPKNIKSMFAAAAVKPKKISEKTVNLNDDELLGDIMSELQQAPTATLKPASVKSTKTKGGARVTSNPFATKVTPKRPNPVKSITPRNVSNEFNSMGRKKYEIESKKAKITPSLEEMDSSVDISEFNTEEMNAASESIEMDDTDTGKENEVMDVSGIDFEDDFGQENVKAAVAESKPSIKAAVPDSGFLENVTTNWSGSRGEPIIPASEVQVDSSQLPLTTENGETFLRMYWLDAYEDHYKQPGIVYLFGKVWIESAKAHVSCCLAVKNIERKVYLLPRQTRAHPKTLEEDGETPVSFIDVYKEFDDTTADKYKIMQFKSRKVTRSYSFEKEDIPAESEYMEVRYPADKPALPQDLKGETFSAVFGSNTSSLENFLLDRKLKGPCWIDIKKPELPNPPISWCKVEAAVSNPDFISVTSSTVPLPPVVVMTMNLRTLPNPKNHQNEVIAVSCLVQHKLLMDKPAPKPAFSEHFCAITRPSDCVFPFDFKEKVAQQTSMKIDVMGNERALLGYLLAKIHKIDPDVIVGHDAFSFDIDVLLHRINHNKIPHWSKIGRLKRANMPKLSNHFGAKNSSSANATCGRLVSDVKISAKELIRCRSYDLNELVNHILKEKRIEIDVDIIRQQYANSSHLLKFVELTLVDSTYILRIMYELMVLPLALQITNICGNVMARTLMGGRAERNEYLLLHAFTEKNFIVPDKSYGKKQVVEEDVDEDDPDHGSKTKKSGRRKPAYAGGLVLEPKKGFYDKFILLLDFNSLYPSIIQEYNICFTTITKDTNTNAEDEEVEPILPDPGLEPGVLPTEIRKLVQSRKQVKQLMKLPDLSHELYMQYDIRQKALKLTANSMYGCLGFTFSRFYAKPLAALVTGKGREILMQTKDLVQGMNLDVIYGDTDSIMVNSNSTDLDEVFKLGNKIKTEVNKLYKLLEIDIDGVFKSMLLLKKKKYAALTAQKVGDKIVYKEELKGLDIVRRDWCSLAKQAGEYVVKQILSGESRELILENIHGKLMDVAEQVEGGNLEVGLFEITKSLTKNPEDYPDKKSLPHVQVALRMNSKGGKKLRSGDAVYYVVCDDGSKLPPSQRAYHPEELAKRDDLKLDTKYYLSNQIHPVVSRLCDPIDGTDAARIAECLGLDPSGYRQSINVREQGEDDGLLAGGLESDDDKYRNCEPFLFKCPTCSKENIIDAVYGGAEELLECKFDKCANNVCGKDFGEYMPLLFNRLSLVIRKNIKKYYEGWLKCEDTACAARTRKVPLIIFKGHPQCPVCRKGRMHPEYTDGMLYRQLCYYRNIFDIDKALATYKNGNTKEARKAENLAHMHRNVYHQIMQYVDKKIRQSAYSEVDLSRLFQGLAPLK